jgi:hypothetical protein
VEYGNERYIIGSSDPERVIRMVNIITEKPNMTREKKEDNRNHFEEFRQLRVYLRVHNMLKKVTK